MSLKFNGDRKKMIQNTKNLNQESKNLKKLLNQQIPQTPKQSRLNSKFSLGGVLFRQLKRKTPPNPQNF